MISNLLDYLIGVAVGVRYRPNFSIEDSLGNIIDKILYTKDSYFNPEMFPEAISQGDEKILINKTTGNQLRINHSDIILEMNFQEEPTDSLLNKIKSSFDEQGFSPCCKWIKSLSV